MHVQYLAGEKQCNRGKTIKRQEGEKKNNTVRYRYICKVVNRRAKGTGSFRLQ